MLKFILIRHATTQANEHKKLSGFHESEISQKGKSEIEALTKELGNYTIDAIYTSPSRRALETVQQIADKHGLSTQIIEELREIYFGDFEGLSFQMISERYPDEMAKMIELGDHYSYPSGESLVQSYERVSKRVDHMKKVHKEQTVLICAHAGTLRNILSHLIIRSPKLHWHFKIDNASLTVVTIEDDFAVIEKLNDTYFIKNMI